MAGVTTWSPAGQRLGEGGEGGHAAGEGEAGGGAVEVGEDRLGVGDRGAALAGVDIGLARGVGLVAGEGGGEVDRRLIEPVTGSMWRSACAARVAGERGRVMTG